MWQPATERLQHFQTMLKSKLNVLTLKKEPIPAVLFHEPEAIELCTTTPLMKARTHSGCKVQYRSPTSLGRPEKSMSDIRVLFSGTPVLRVQISHD
uniref:Phosphotyrosine interaction domain containing 1 n=1 Tax=Mus spicilegus TaxID=10103 RepID=A0A8C6GY60_MUSSI